MTIFRIPPPEGTDPEVEVYTDLQLQATEHAIDSINDIKIRYTVPDKPREGRIYYLKEDLNNIATEGYWAWINGSWQKFNMGNSVYETDYVTQELNRRCAIEST